ncbi:Luciferin 4-monooxygenase [Operophtera brumata]|uniref:Luciferin 4-monooxygenase n=1 Tax=Operophtera brumata TaxID=104452 RepID=A0A0L7LHE0_OPEBR|nr:Luciferin 4-monooxygenase [Operophtera brumata]
MNKLQKYSGPSIISGDQSFAIPSHGNYGKFVLDKILENKDRVALINGGTGDQVTYGEMAQQVVNTAYSLNTLGIGAGDVVGICSENRTEFLITAIAGMCTEAVVTFINSAYSKGAEKTALILYSSGTTGLPKGAKLSHRNLIISGLQPFNTVGIILTMDQIVYNQTVVYLNKFNEENYLKCIEKYKIVDVETRTVLGPNQPGEVCVKGPVLFQGYCGKDLGEDLDSEGFYCSGDVAYYDEDGYFFIVDRIKELIKYKAGQVAPSELEAILRQHHGVKDAAVIGTPDPLAGELPTAFVVKMAGVSVTEKELIDFVGSKVSSWKKLRGGVRFVEEIPKNGSGKILRRKLRDMIMCLVLRKPLKSY